MWSRFNNLLTHTLTFFIIFIRTIVISHIIKMWFTTFVYDRGMWRCSTPASRCMWVAVLHCMLGLHNLSFGLPLHLLALASFSATPTPPSTSPRTPASFTFPTLALYANPLHSFSKSLVHPLVYGWLIAVTVFKTGYIKIIFTQSSGGSLLASVGRRFSTLQKGVFAHHQPLQNVYLYMF